MFRLAASDRSRNGYVDADKVEEYESLVEGVLFALVAPPDVPQPVP